MSSSGSGYGLGEKERVFWVEGWSGGGEGRGVACCCWISRARSMRVPMKTLV